ncbi:MAG TPA: FkbM family methyltransferase [Planctomycetota bacterium]|nr:FkbM family methyltransferase [Planctomycetota bacterium]
MEDNESKEINKIKALRDRNARLKEKVGRLRAQQMASESSLRSLIALAATGDPRVAAVSAPVRSRLTLPGSAGEFNALLVTTDGMRFFVPEARPDDPPDAFRTRVLEKGWYPLEMIRNLLPFTRGGTMLDVGANIGTTCVPRAFLGHFSYIHAFEPEPRNFACLEAAVAANRTRTTVVPWHLAVGAENRAGSLLNAGGMARYRVSPSGAEPGRGSGAVPISIVSLDSWLAENRIPAEDIRFVKVDTQGFDLDVLLGARALLDCRDVVWQLEVCPRLFALAGRSLETFVRFLESSFEWYLDLRRPAGGFKPSSEAAQALAYLTAKEPLRHPDEEEWRHTDIIALNAPARSHAPAHVPRGPGG